MSVAAARLALRSLPSGTANDAIDQLWFSTSTPTYLEKNNASIVHAVLGLPRSTPALDLGGANRSAAGLVPIACGLEGSTVLLAAADMRGGLVGSPDEAQGGDAGAALIIGNDSPDAPVIAEFVGAVSVSEEFLDRWRVPGESRTRQWEERFGEGRYAALAWEALDAIQQRLDVSRGDIDALVVTGQSDRAVGALVKKANADADPLAASIGVSGSTYPLVRLVEALERAKPGDLIVLIHLSDGAEAIAFRATEALSSYSPRRSTAAQLAAGDDGLPYAKFLSWRQMLPIDPPRRPEPARMSASAAARATDWKYSFVGNAEAEGGAVHLPPGRVSFDGETVDSMVSRPMADATGTIVTFTVDKLVYSPSPPVVFAVVDFDDGGRMPIELTDTRPDAVSIGQKVEMTFRRLNTADGIANYFWKGTPLVATDPVSADGDTPAAHTSKEA